MASTRTCLFALALVAAPAAGEDVVVVLTKDIAPYREALRGVRSVCTASLRTFVLEDGAAALPAELDVATPRVIVAIGTGASRLVTEQRPDVPLVFCMVLDPDSAGVLGPNATGVPMVPETDQQGVGGMAVIHGSYSAMGQQAGMLVGQILAGASPADLPRQPTPRDVAAEIFRFQRLSALDHPERPVQHGVDVEAFGVRQSGGIDQ